MRTRALAVLMTAVLLATTGCLATIENTGPVWNGSSHTDPTGSPVCDEEPGTHYTEFETGEYLVNVDNTVVDGLCLINGAVIIDADNVVLKNSTIVGDPPTYFNPVVSLAGSDNVLVQYNVIDCGDAFTGTEEAAQGIRSPEGLTSGFAHNNEIRDCTDGIQAASNWTYSYNYIHRPDNTDEAHADGVQWDTEDDLSPIHDVLFEWNTIRFPDASSSFQYHSNNEPTQGAYNIVVRYNSFWGGAAVVRIPRYGNGGNEFYGNHLKRMTENEFFVCTSTENGTDTIDVWGRETGSPNDWDEDGVILDDDNVNEENDTIIDREDCE